LDQAEMLQNEGHADVVPSLTTIKKSSSPVGAIVGGVIGGLAVIVLGAIAAYFIYRRKRRHIIVSPTQVDASGHSRTTSDVSQKSTLIGFGYKRLNPSRVTSPTTQPPSSPMSAITMHTHNSSVNSLSYFGSVNHSIYPSSPPAAVARTLSPSPPPVAYTRNREDIIVPFTLDPSPEAISRQESSANLADRKRADGAIITNYDPPNSSPLQLGANVGPSMTDVTSTVSRSRLNPPAYSAVDEASVVNARVRQTHGKKGSDDTQHSIDSNLSAGVATARHGHTASGGSTISAIDEVLAQMGFEPSETGSGTGGTLSTGQSRQFAEAQPFRPVLGNPDS